METHARSAEQSNTRQGWGLLLALIVHQTHSLQLAASQIPHVNVTLGTRDKTEAHAHSAPLALTSLDWGPLVQAVPLIQSLRLAVSKTPHVSAMQVIRGQMERHVCSVMAARIK